MKKLRYVIAILAVATLGMFAISSCTKASNDIIGNWYYKLEDLKITLHFSKDLTGYEKWEDSDGLIDNEEFTYEYNSATKELIWVDEYGDSETFEAEIEGKELTIIDEDGFAMTFHR